MIARLLSFLVPLFLPLAVLAQPMQEIDPRSIWKDGTKATTAEIPFAYGISVGDGTTGGTINFNGTNDASLTWSSSAKHLSLIQGGASEYTYPSYEAGLLINSVTGSGEYRYAIQAWGTPSSGANTVGGFWGGYQDSGTSYSIGEAYGGSFYNVFGSTTARTITSIFGNYIGNEFATSSGITASDIRGLYIAPMSSGSIQTTTNVYGIQIDASSTTFDGAAPTNYYGIRLAGPTGFTPTNNYGIFLNTSGNVTFRAGTQAVWSSAANTLDLTANTTINQKIGSNPANGTAGTVIGTWKAAGLGWGTTNTYDIGTSSVQTRDIWAGRSVYAGNTALPAGTNANVIDGAIQITATGADTTGVYNAIDIDADYTANDGASLHLPTMRAINIDMDFTRTASAFMAETAQIFKADLTIPASSAPGTSDGSKPFDVAITDNSTSGSWGQGIVDFRATVASASGNNIGLRSVMDVTGNGNAYGYQGYARGRGTGATVGVDGFCYVANTNSLVVGVNSQPRAFGTPPNADLVMAFRGQTGHWLASQGSGIFTSTSRTTPNATTTGHLNFLSNTGELYTEGAAEIDGNLYADAKIGIGLASAVTPTNEISLSGQAARKMWMERHTTSNTAGNQLTIESGGATSGATNKAGGKLVLSSGISTGSQSSTLELWTAAGSSSGTTDRSPSVKLAIAGTGAQTLTQTSTSGFNGVTQNFTTTAMNGTAAYGQFWTHTHTGMIDSQAYGLQLGLIATASASDTGGSTAQGFSFEVYEDGDHTANTGMAAAALGGFVRHSSTATGLTFTGFNADIQVNTGASAADLVLYQTGASLIGANTTSWTGLYVVNPVPSAGTITTTYGIRLEDITGATTNYAIYSAGGQSVHAGKLRLGSTTAPAEVLDVTGNIQENGTFISTRTSDLNWSWQAAADQACNTTCTHACAGGINVDAGFVAGAFVSCATATADVCLCAGPT